MHIFTRLDNGRLKTHVRAVNEIMYPAYGASTEHITTPRPRWIDNPDLHRRYSLQKMMPGSTLVVGKVETYRKKTISRWWVEGEEYPLEQAVVAIAAAAEKEHPLPFFKLSVLQKRILRYWLDYEQRVGEPPYITEATRALNRSIQYLGEQIVQMSEWDIMYKVGGVQAKELWHVNLDRIALISLEE